MVTGGDRSERICQISKHKRPYGSLHGLDFIFHVMKTLKEPKGKRNNSLWLLGKKQIYEETITKKTN